MKQTTIHLSTSNDGQTLRAKWQGNKDDYIQMTDAFCKDAWDHIPEVYEIVSIDTIDLLIVHNNISVDGSGYVYAMLNNDLASTLAGKLSFPQDKKT